jgi:hypothetical protein
VTYTGATTPAAITTAAASAGRIADAIVASVQITTALATNLVPAPPQPGSYTQTYAGKGGGTATVTASFAADGTGSETISYASYNSGDGLQWSGAQTYQVLAPANATHPHSALVLNDLRVVSRTTTLALAGSVDRIDTTPQAPGAIVTYTITSNLVIEDSRAARALKTEQLAITTQPPTATGSETVSGRVYESSMGYVDVTSDAPFIVPPEYDRLLTGGPVRAHGAAATLWLAPVTTARTALELDAGDSGQPNQAVLIDNSRSAEAQLAQPASAPPAAAAGPARSVTLGATQTLEGRFSGADSNVWVRFDWTLALSPPGSHATLAGATSPTPTLTPDLRGQYLAVLTISDGSHTSSDTVTLTVPYPDANPPTPDDPNVAAYLGPDTALSVGDTIGLTTAWSRYLPLGSNLTYSFGVTDPSGATAGQSVGDASVAPPSVTATAAGFYTATLSLNMLNTGTATRYYAVGQPLRYHRPVGLRALPGVSHLAIGDLAGDGHPGLVITGNQAGAVVPQGLVWIYRGTGPGQFAAPVELAEGDAGGVVLGDFNGDGHLDLAVETLAGLDLVLQNADGSWAAPRPLPAPPPCAAAGAGRALVAADFNGDGRIDLAAGDPCGGAVDVYFQDAGATFSTATLATQPGFPPVLAVADVNGDGFPDLIVGVPAADSGSAPKLLVYPGGSAGFGAPVTYAVPNSLGNPLLLVVAGDYNGDRKADVVVMTNSGFFAFLQGAAGLGTPVALAGGLPVSAWPGGLALRDIDGDGRIDIVTYGGLSGAVTAMLQQGDGTLAAPVPFFPGQAASAGPVAFADLTGDGLADLVYPGLVLAVGGPDIVVVPAAQAP